VGTLLRSCAKVCEPMELSFEVVSRVGHGTGELDGGPHAPREGVSGILFPHCFGGMNRHFQAKCTKYTNVHIMETTPWIPRKFCIPVKTSKYASWVFQKRGKQINMVNS